MKLKKLFTYFKLYPDCIDILAYFQHFGHQNPLILRIQLCDHDFERTEDCATVFLK